MPSQETIIKKGAYLVSLKKMLTTYNKILVVNADNVGSKQIQQIRICLRGGTGEMLMGKNTLMRKGVREILADNPKLEVILPLLKGNCGLIFTNGELSALKEVVDTNKVGAAAKAGVVAPCSVTIDAGPTGLEPTQTAFFQALSISTKINRGQIEILAPVHLIEEGQKVGPSEAALLQKLDLKPFAFGLVCVAVYDDGSTFDAKVLDLTTADILAEFSSAIIKVASVSLATGFATLAAVPHVAANAFKDVLAVSIAADFEIEQNKEIRAFLADPTAFASAAPVAAKEEEAAKESESESDDDMGFSLFD